MLSYPPTERTNEHHLPVIHWLGSSPTSLLTRLPTTPIRSPQRQAILRFLHASPTPQHINAILRATSYNRDAGRKMLFTTANHPCLTPPPSEQPPVPSVPGPLPQAQTPAHGLETSVSPVLSREETQDIGSGTPAQDVSSVPSQVETSSPDPEALASPVPSVPIDSSPPQNSLDPPSSTLPSLPSTGERLPISLATGKNLHGRG